MDKIVNKILLGFTIILMIIWLIYYCFVNSIMQAKNKEIELLKAQIVECRVQQDKARDAIDRQNNAIDAIKIIDTVYMDRIKTVERKYEIIREAVRDDTETRGYCEITTIDTLLRGFAMHKDSY